MERLAATHKHIDDRRLRPICYWYMLIRELKQERKTITGDLYVTAKGERFFSMMGRCPPRKGNQVPTREALVGYWAGVAHQTLYRLRIYERQAHLHLHQRVHLLQLQLREGETIWGGQAKRLLLLDRWRGTSYLAEMGALCGSRRCCCAAWACIL
jgi:hypothetical protein